VSARDIGVEQARARSGKQRQPNGQASASRGKHNCSFVSTSKVVVDKIITIFVNNLVGIALTVFGHG
jgi:hypothetical protein